MMIVLLMIDLLIDMCLIVIFVLLTIAYMLSKKEKKLPKSWQKIG